jgi:UPF0716 protein FxsA
MFMRLLMLFILVPVIEIYILVKAGQHIGAMNTIALIILTGIVGASLAKSQGSQIIYKIRDALNQGQLPGRELLQGAMVLTGGIMLLTPGFITDLFGFSLLFPFTRGFYTGLALDYFKKKFRTGQWQYNSPSTHDESDGPVDVIINHPKIDGSSSEEG